MNIAPILLMLAADLLILGRCLWILNRMHPAGHARSYAHFAGFGGSYVVLALGAAAQGLQILNNAAPDLSDWCFCLASAGLILTDRRGRRREAMPGMTIDTLHHPREF